MSADLRSSTVSGVRSMPAVVVEETIKIAPVTHYRTRHRKIDRSSPHLDAAAAIFTASFRLIAKVVMLILTGYPSNGSRLFVEKHSRN